MSRELILPVSFAEWTTVMLVKGGSLCKGSRGFRLLTPKWLIWAKWLINISFWSLQGHNFVKFWSHLASLFQSYGPASDFSLHGTAASDFKEILFFLIDSFRHFPSGLDLSFVNFGLFLWDFLITKIVEATEAKIWAKEATIKKDKTMVW